MEQIYKPNIAARILVFLMTFCFVFSIQLIFSPIGTRALLGVIGVLYLFVRNLSKVRDVLINGRLMVDKYILRIGLSLISIAGIAIFVSFVNGTNERMLISYPISMILIFAGAYLVTDTMRRVYHRLDLKLVSLYFIRVVVVQLIISIVIFSIPELKSFVAVIMRFDEITLQEMLKENGFRLMGFGVQFFAAGIINSFTLVLIALCIKDYARTFMNMFYYTFSFILITVVGMAMSRTTMIGVGLAMGILILGIKTGARFNKSFAILKSLLVLGIMVCSLILYLPDETKFALEKVGEYGFEMAVNYFEKGEITTDSSEELKLMYDTYPNELRTWIIGDGWFSDPITEGLYYRHVDVGYLRLIFYVGLIGMIAYFIYQYMVIFYFNYLTNGKCKLFVLTVSVLLLILNLKGFTDFTQLISMFLFIPREKPLTNDIVNDNKGI